MKTYELIIEQRQPPCCGKSPVDLKIPTVTTHAPLAYVKDIETDGAPRLETPHHGQLTTRHGRAPPPHPYTLTDQ